MPSLHPKRLLHSTRYMRKTQLYDRRPDELTLEEIEKIRL
jgi:hypothetical protein